MKKKDIVCPHCRYVNPPKAYVCVRCYKVIYEKYKVSFWKMQVPSVTGTLLFSLGLFISLAVILHHWLAAVEADMTDKAQTAAYEMSLAAERMRKAKLQHGSVVVATEPAAGSVSTSPR